MKLQKPLLGITTTILAFAGILAGRQLHSPLIDYYYTLKNGTYCNTVASVCTRQGGTLTCFSMVTDGTIDHFQVQVPVFTRGPKGLNSAGRCTRLIKYSGAL